MKRHFTKILISGAFIGGSFVTIREYCHNNLLDFVEKFKVHAASKSNESHEPESKSELKLVMAQVFFRHGARLPITDLPGFDDVTYDNDFVMAPVPYATIDVNVTDLSGNERPYSALEAHYSKYKMKGGRRGGGLTALGRDQCYLLGKRLRERYVEKLGLLSSIFDADEIYVRSTNTDRTIESVQSTLAGMFGQTGVKSVPNIQVAPDNVEILYPNSHHCKVLKEAMTCARKTLARTHHDPWLLPLLKEVTEHMGWKGDERWQGYVDMMGVRDHLFVRRLYGLPIPKFYEERESQINDAAIITIRYLMAGTKWTEPIVLKISTGPVLRLIQSNISDALSQKSKHKMYIYSCHDSSLVPLLVAFGCYKHHWPQYGADLCIELYEDTAGKRWVKLVYCDEEQVPESSNTGALVPLEQFQAMLARYAPNTMEDYYNNCSSPRCFQELASVCVVDTIKTSPAKLGTAIPAN